MPALLGHFAVGSSVKKITFRTVLENSKGGLLIAGKGFSRTRPTREVWAGVLSLLGFYVKIQIVSD